MKFPNSNRRPKEQKEFPDLKSYAAYLSDFYNFPIGVSMLVPEDRVIPNSPDYESRKSEEYHGIVGIFKIDQLTETQKEVLYILENRAKEYYGETKIYNKRIATLINKSLSTVEKSIKRLEELKFISTYTTKYLRKGKFYSDRIIRCKRTWFESQFKVVTKKAWRYCRRPKNIKGVYFLGREVKFNDIMSIIKWKPTMKEAMRWGFYDPEEQRVYQDFLNWRDVWGYADGVERLGYRKKLEFEYLTPVPEDCQRKPFYEEKPSGPYIDPERKAQYERMQNFFKR